MSCHEDSWTASEAHTGRNGGLLPTASEEVRLPANGPVSRPYWEQIFLSEKVAKWLQSWLSCQLQPHERCKLIETLGKDSWLQRFRENIHYCSWLWLFRPSLIPWLTAKDTEGQLKNIMDKGKHSESFSQLSLYIKKIRFINKTPHQNIIGLVSNS